MAIFPSCPTFISVDIVTVSAGGAGDTFGLNTSFSKLLVSIFTDNTEGETDDTEWSVSYKPSTSYFLTWSSEALLLFEAVDNVVVVVVVAGAGRLWEG